MTKLNEILSEIGISKVKLAKYLGVSRQMVYNYLDMDDIPIDTLTHIFKIAKKIKLDLEEKLKCDGVTFVQNNGDIQEVKHFHLHLKPYYKNNIIKEASEVYELLKK